MDPKKSVDTWSVTDLNATMLKPDSTDLQGRIHDVAPGVRFTLFSDRPTPMPEKYARLFLKDPAFVVRNSFDVEMVGLSEEQAARTAPNTRLPPDMVVAKLDELTDDALRTRAAVHPKYADLPENPDRALMLDFLLGIFTPETPAGFDDDIDGGRENAAATAAKLLEGA